MIRITSYDETINKKKIYDRYLYLLCYILPFYPKDILGNDQIYVDGKMINADNFLLVSKKRPRYRTKEYLGLLEDFGIYANTDSDDITQKFKEDWSLAAIIIKNADINLFSFLYINESGRELQVQRENLRKLLLSKMNCLDDKLKLLSILSGKYSYLLTSNVFRYEKFALNHHATLILKDMNVTVCPYCNRQYTFTITSEKNMIRPQFDHYKCKTRYPYFAVSLFNLVPSCPLCNLYKGDKPKEVLYPYSDELGTDFVFRTKGDQGVRYLLGEEDAEDEISLELIQTNTSISRELVEKVNNSKQIFHLIEMYEEHKDYILQIFRKNYIYNEEYLSMLNSEFTGLFKDMQEMKKMFYVMDIDPTKWGSRPLSKLAHDMDQEINELLIYADSNLNIF